MKSIEVKSIEFPFKGLKDEVVEIKIANKDLRLMPEVGDAEAFMVNSGEKKKVTLEDLQKSREIFVNMVQRAYSDVDIEDIKALIARNYNDIFLQTAAVFGFITQEQIEKLKKKVLERMEKSFEEGISRQSKE